MRYYEPPTDHPVGTVFDPEDETFGPIMAAIQRGDFEVARDALDALCKPTKANAMRDAWNTYPDGTWTPE